MGRMLQDWINVEHFAETKKMRRMMQEDRKPKGKWQRLPDGTWGYPPEPTAEDAQAALERGWRMGWEAGYAAAKNPEPVA